MAAFSMMCGASPVPASTAQSGRHRLNRGGNRRANRALHDVALNRMLTDARTREYVEKKRGEGKTKREAIRCLMRFVAREVYRLLTSPAPCLPDVGDLKARRQKLSLTQAQAAELADLPPRKIGCLERRVTFATKALLSYEKAIVAQESLRIGA